MVIVVIKLIADEDMVTYLRIKLAESRQEVEAKDRHMLTCETLTFETIVPRSEENNLDLKTPRKAGLRSERSMKEQYKTEK